MKSWLRTILYFMAAILITAFVTATVTLKTVEKKRTDEVVLTAAEYAELSDLMVFNEVINKISSDSFYDPPARDALIDAGIVGMLASVDDEYSQYYTAEEYEQYLENVSGTYTGIGILVGQPEGEGATILDVYDNAPAAAAGVAVGDVIVAVDSVPVEGLLLDELADMLNRAEGEEVTLSVTRDGATLDFTLVSAPVTVSHVEHFLFNERTGYIRISMFTGNVVEDFTEALNDLTDRRMRSLVIDLRNNPGGSLASVVSITDLLIGESDIVSIRGRLEGDSEVYTSNKKGVKVPVAIIVNENSASASEILAAAVRDTGTGVVVGMTTFGKGVVQTTFHLENRDAWLKLTTDAYFTPSGASIDGVGVVPDIEVDLPDEMLGIPIDELPQEDDAQLWAALDYVRAAAEGD